MYMNNQKWRLIYMYIYMCVDISYVHIFFENVKFIVVNLKLDVEQYIYIFFYHNFLQTDYDKFYIVRIYMYTHIYIHYVLQSF